VSCGIKRKIGCYTPPTEVAPVGVRVYRFGDFKLDCDRFELLRGERSLKLERKPMELLILLAAKNGHLVTRAEISERLWEQEVFVDTEHGINTAVRKIRQALRDDSEQPRFVQTVTGKGYRFIGTIEEDLVPELAPMSDVAEVAPVAIVPEVQAAKPDSRRWVWVGMLVVVALLIVAGVRYRRGGRSPIRSLAVLPLENLTGDPGQEYVAEGLTDELITMLAKNSTLRITSRTSVMQYKGVHRPLPEIARALGVDGILEGSVSRSGDETHMTIQLIEAPNDSHVWAESYNRDTNGLVSLPKEAAQAIAKRLNSSVPQQTVVRYVSPEAHDAYLRGRYLWFTDHTREAGPYFKRATELQPDYALGWSGLGMYYGASCVKGELRPADCLPQTAAAAAKAVRLDDSLAEAHLAMAGAELESRWNLVRADAETLRAIELDPKFAEAYHLRAKILAAQNRHADAIEAQRIATELDPFTRPWAMALALMEARQYDAALKDAREKQVAFPDNTILLGIIHVIYERMGRQQEAVDSLAKVLAVRGQQHEAEVLRRAFAEGGYTAVVRWKMEGLKMRAAKSYVSPLDLANRAAQLGDKEQALTLLEAGYREHATQMLWMQNDPAFDSLHREERYRAIVKGIGLPAVY
jgi:TolB-like protein/DNA-binding winged helix-turn-helix (wHTH) protein